MSYLVLARKWRPKRFAELVGQEHVVRALSNALDSGRVHHAYLFTGTRGVGKTTIARIFAKSLNCEQGTGADPCGVCETCQAIDAGRYIDLLEIDAASNTGVDNVRDLIDNAQYMPSRGRYKVYLIDEVHMLSKPAFNALLKTLEEPPGHVKFLFATTDPEKLLVTVLSRCLQFNLKRLDEAQIGGQITKILGAEGIAAEPGAITQLARAADGSLRDGLSLLDQAIAYTGAAAGAGTLADEAVARMLGTVDRTRIGALLEALAAGDGARLMAEIDALAEVSPDWSGVLDAMAAALHRIQLRQLVPGIAEADDALDIAPLAAALRPELVQLWYQMALGGRRDLPLAPSPRAGFEMSLLRMLAFRPVEGAGQAGGPEPSTARAPSSAGRGSAAAAARAALDADMAGPSRAAAPIQASAPERRSPAPPADLPAPRRVPAPDAAPAPVVAAAMPETGATGFPAAPAAPASTLGASLDAGGWLDLVGGLALRGPVRELAAHAAFVSWREGILRLSLPAADDHLKAPFLVSQLAQALAPTLGAEPQIRFEDAVASAGETLHARNARQRDARQAAAEQAFLADPQVQRLMQQQGARLVPDSIRPYDEG
ncbi:DNA polymerase III subunit gamma/tau [Luteimonas kalidii]|uniref:DNA polymerase III subunit gamma/tau n=1 Tax=Luteimonas kalidii TaxID=3042025 RepID=A0ABT6JVW5_9GAMM|nr:DNA polymerase III subunit gamma/tau [Luteimonas kalidii]MDH5834734.1 DNA polymerase III subunit gamma/tau [Luteimonas kalidii]